LLSTRAWRFFHNKPGEQDVKQALSILQSLRNGEASAIQPPHWLVEAMSVFSREAPPFAEEALEVLKVLDLPFPLRQQLTALGRGFPGS
jgi:hypothetical protein